MDIKQLIVLALQVAIIGTVFAFGLRATLDDVLYVLRRPGLLIRSFLAVLVVMPMLVVVFVKVFDCERPSRWFSSRLREALRR